MSITEFMHGQLLYAFPPPGGPLFFPMGLRSNQDHDAYISSVAATIKTRQMNHGEAIEFLQRKVRIIENQRHFDKQIDERMVARLNAWIQELAS